MPRKKKIAKDEIPTLAGKPEESETKAEPTPPEPKPLPTFDGAQVLEILGEDASGQAYHCQLSNGTTAFLSKELFE